MKKKLILLLCVAAPMLLAAQQPPYSAEVLKRMEAVEQSVSLNRFVIKGAPSPTLEERMAYYGVKGVSVAVINNGKVEWAKGYGWADAEQKIPVTTETLFQPGSISKSLNAMAVLSLVEDKKLSLKTDINQQLKSWQFPYDTSSHGKVITLRNLLSHTAGLGVHGFPGYEYGVPRPTVPQILDGAPPANTPPVRSLFEPGLRMQYSGGGTMISQLMAMDATGLPYDELVRRRVFAPLGMTSSFFTQPIPDSLRSRMALGYTDRGKPVPDGHTILLEQAAGGLWTTPSDLCKYILEVQQSRVGKSNKVLSKKTTQLMLTPYLDPNAGLGVFVEDHNGELYFQHAAGNVGFCGKYYGSFEDGRGMVVFLNGDYAFPLIDEIMNAILRTYGWEGWAIDSLEEMDTVKIAPNDFSRYAGLYRDGEVITRIAVEDDHLTFQATDKPWMAHFTNDSTFFNLESKTVKHFRFDAQGRATGYSRWADGKMLSEAVRLPDFAPSPEDRQRFLGKYLDGQGGVMEVFAQGDGLFIKDTEESFEMHFISPTDFFTAEYFNYRFSMVLDEQQEVKGILMQADGQEFLMEKVR
jgi:CubicO group peptidase (beta-lactamase class C family)